MNIYILFFVVAVFLWGTDPAVTKRFLLVSLAPTEMTAMRLGIASITMLPFVLGELKKLRSLTRRDWLSLAALVVIGTTAMNLLYYEALTKIPAFMLLILFRLEPVFVIVLSAIFLNQRISLRTWLLTLAAIACAAVVSLGKGAQLSALQISGLGIGLALLASICSAIGTLLAKDLLKKISPLALNVVRAGLTSALILTAMGSRLETEVIPTLTPNEVWGIVLTGVIYSGIGFWMYYKGLQHIAPLIGSVIQLLRIVSGLAASYLLLAEIPSPIQWVGVAGLLVALFYLTRPETMAQLDLSQPSGQIVAPSSKNSSFPGH